MWASKQRRLTNRFGVFVLYLALPYIKTLLDEITIVKNHVAVLNGVYARFRIINIMGMGIFGLCYDGPFGKDGSQREFALDHGFYSAPGKVNIKELMNGKILAVGELSKPIDDPLLFANIKAEIDASPSVSATNIALEKDDDSAPSCCLTIKQALAILNESSVQTPRTQQVFSVNATLASKKISIFGFKNSPSSSILSLIVKVYKLNLIHINQMEWQITTPFFIASPSIVNLKDSFTAITPLPWQEYYQGVVTNVKANHASHDTINVNNLTPQFPINSTDFNTDKIVSRKIFDSFARKIDSDVEVSIAHSPTKAIFVKDSGDEPRQLIVSLSVLSRFKAILNFENRYSSDYLDAFDKMVIRIPTSSSPENNIIQIGKFNNSGTFVVQKNLVIK